MGIGMRFKAHFAFMSYEFVSGCSRKAVLSADYSEASCRS